MRDSCSAQGTPGGTFARRLILNHIPVFDHHTVLKTQAIDHDPVRRLAEASEASLLFCVANVVLKNVIDKKYFT
ncbi:hypothetical protein KW849_05065 [Pseudomonas sp. PDM26]|uniref:hypothetical protein n=1 Tax=Pseudomonas sp. PDM26 TaxID=2854766 RepID=UPI001C4664E0|nr:hypothetical protein [Pseudomonas sp. PDM26]MBV7545677.1 hypothetical protein [Pseudomonas sp. PDM26]